MLRWRGNGADGHPVDRVPGDDRRGRNHRSHAGPTAAAHRIVPLSVDYANEPERCHCLIAALLEEYEEYVNREHEICPGCPVIRSGCFIAYSLLEWKAVYADGRLDHWTRADIHAYLLEHFPRKVCADDQLLRDTPTCVRDLMYFLSDRGTLAGDDLDVLAEAADEVAEAFARANRDPRNWGLAKAMFMRVGAIEAADQPTMAPVIDRAPRASKPARTGAIGGRRRKRKAARAARKRSRR